MGHKHAGEAGKAGYRVALSLGLGPFQSTRAIPVWSCSRGQGEEHQNPNGLLQAQPRSVGSQGRIPGCWGCILSM